MVATLALHWNARGIFEALWTGFGALFLAFVLAGLALAVLMLLASVLYAVFRAELLYFVAAVATLMLGNVIFLGRIFRACYRVQH
ncbi:MAG: hypothetical protein KIS92_24955, partial [Planctomycetota bacterium]|nr:hypothetical protein [Planctomycetota bacterium]